MLYTNLKHIESAAEYERVVSESESLLIICGRMGPMCIPVYRVAEKLESAYPHVLFYDMEFDNPESQVIRSLPEVSAFMSIPFMVYYKKGEVVRATSGLQTEEQVKAILNEEFAAVHV